MRNKKEKDSNKIKPIIKFNGGNPVCLCNTCRKMITMGLLYCEDCKPKD